MDVLLGPVAIAAVVVLLAGAQKVVDPAPTVGALRAQGLPGSPALVRVLAVSEIIIGIAVLVSGHAVALVALGALYLGFVAFVVAAIERDLPLASCGCFGRDDTPPTWVHAVVNLVFAGAALGAAPAAQSFDAVLADQPALGIPFIGFVAIGVGLTWLTLSVLPAVLAPDRVVSASRRGVRS